MVKSKFNARSRIIIAIAYVWGAIALLLAIAVILNYFKNGLDTSIYRAIIFCIAVMHPSYYLLIYKRVLIIYEDRLVYYSMLLPFVKKQFMFNDIDYIITEDSYSRNGKHFLVATLVKNKLKLMKISARVYSNLDELLHALPWQYKGHYCSDSEPTRQTAPMGNKGYYHSNLDCTPQATHVEGKGRYYFDSDYTLRDVENEKTKISSGAFVTKSRLNTNGYFVIILAFLIQVVALVIVVSVFFWGIKTVSEAILLAIILQIALSIPSFFMLKHKRELLVYDDRLVCRSIVLPFFKKQYMLYDIDFMVTEDSYSRYGTHYLVAVLMKDKRALLKISAKTYSNLHEIVRALPWRYKGHYYLNAWRRKEFHEEVPLEETLSGEYLHYGFKINEDRIQPMNLDGVGSGEHLGYNKNYGSYNR